MTEQQLEILEKYFPKGCVISYFQPNDTLITERLLGNNIKDPDYEEKNRILWGLITMMCELHEEDIREAGGLEPSE